MGLAEFVESVFRVAILDLRLGIPHAKMAPAAGLSAQLTAVHTRERHDPYSSTTETPGRRRRRQSRLHRAAAPCRRRARLGKDCREAILRPHGCCTRIGDVKTTHDLPRDICTRPGAWASIVHRRWMPSPRCGPIHAPQPRTSPSFASRDLVRFGADLALPGRPRFTMAGSAGYRERAHRGQTIRRLWSMRDFEAGARTGETGHF